MYDTKEQIQNRINALNSYVIDSDNAKCSYEKELYTLKEDMKDLVKPEINEDTLDIISEMLREHLEGVAFMNSCFLDPDNYTFDMGLTCDNQIYVESMECNDGDDHIEKLERDIYNDIKSLFKVKIETEEENEDIV